MLGQQVTILFLTFQTGWLFKDHSSWILKGTFFFSVFTSLKSKHVLELIVSLIHRLFSPLWYTKEHLTIDIILYLEKYGNIYFAYIRGAAWWTKHDFWNVKDLLSPWISNTPSFLYSESPLFTSYLIFGKLIIWVSISSCCVSSSYVSSMVLSELSDTLYKVLEWLPPSLLKHSVIKS